MTMNNKFYSSLGFAMRAGKVATGEGTVLTAVRSGKAKLVILASDASDNTQKKFRDKCAHYHVPLVEYGDRSGLGAAIGKLDRVIIAVLDGGFAEMITKCVAKPAEVEKIDE